MQLYYSNTSPYSRKVRLVIHIKGLEKQVKEILVNPFSDAQELKAVNPLGKIPTLILDNGEVLYDSPVICHYLDDFTAAQPLLEKDGWQHWLILRWEALADGMTDAAYNLVMEKRRTVAEQSPTWMAQWSVEIHRVLDKIEADIGTIGDKISLTHLSLGAALGYLEFRLPEFLSPSDYPDTLAWYKQFKTQPVMLLTQPVE